MLKISPFISSSRAKQFTQRCSYLMRIFRILKILRSIEYFSLAKCNEIFLISINYRLIFSSYFSNESWSGRARETERCSMGLETDERWFRLTKRKVGSNSRSIWFLSLLLRNCVRNTSLADCSRRSCSPLNNFVSRISKWSYAGKTIRSDRMCHIQRQIIAHTSSSLAIFILYKIPWHDKSEQI